MKYDSTRLAVSIFYEEVEVIGSDNLQIFVPAGVGTAYVIVLPCEGTFKRHLIDKI